MERTNDTRDFWCSPKDLTELKAIYHDEFGETPSDAEVRAMAERLLHLYSLFLDPVPETRNPLYVSPQSYENLSAAEAKALIFVRENSEAGNLSVRKIGQAAGFRSSRSGWLLVQKLIKRGLLTRTKEGFILTEKGDRFLRVEG